MKYWAAALVRAVEGVSNERGETALTLVRLERGDIRCGCALCHGTSRQNIMPI